MAPPFAGSLKLLDVFLHGMHDFDADLLVLKTNFYDFGQKLWYKSLPTVFELRPLHIASKIFLDSSYKELDDALRGRLEIERDCKKNNCESSEIKSKTSKFDNLFKGYFPSLLDPDCSYESKTELNNEVLFRKCYTGIYNVGNCPSIITKSVNPNVIDFEKDFYCNKYGSTYFYQGECDNNERNCLDHLYYSDKSPYAYDNQEAVDFLIERFNKEFSEEYGKIDKNYFDSHEKIRKGIQYSIDYQKKVDKIKELPIPPVDTELLYSSFNPTFACLVLDDNDFTNDQNTIFKKGGDGTVPTWSSLLTGLKWVYDKTNKNLPQKIKLIEYCSRLAKSEKYGYDPNKEQNFAAIGCECIDDSNIYKKGDKNIKKCSHAEMLSDDNLIEYIYSVVDDPKDNNIITDSKKQAVKSYDPKYDYTKEYNDDIYYTLNNLKQVYVKNK